MNIEKLLPWSPPRKVNTKRGTKIVREAEPTNEFRTIYRGNKEKLKEVGVSLSPPSKWNGNRWMAVWWQDDVEAKKREQGSHATSADADIPCPKGLEYFPYQLVGAKEGAERNLLLADEMGLGKTIQAIGAMNLTEDKKVLVICPASLKLNWLREIERWTTTGIEPYIVKTTKSPIPDSGAVVINFDIVVKQLKTLQKVRWDRVIVDESHRLKNPKAQVTQAVYGHWDSQKSKWVPGIEGKVWTLLTGTPILNRPVELWTALKKINPNGLGKNYMNYVKTYCGAFRDRYGLNVKGASNLDALQVILRQNVMIRRLKKDVLPELPPKVRQIIPLDICHNLVGYEARLLQDYEDLIVRRELTKASEDPTIYEAALVDLDKGKKVKFECLTRVRKELALSKIPAVIEHLEDCVSDENPVIVFCWHTDVAKAIHEAFPDSGLIIGETPQKDRQKDVDDFQAGRSNLIILNIKAGGVGLTLTASSHVIFAELSQVPADLTQAEDRAHRIGQDKCVLIQHIVVDGGLECRMAQMCVDKQKILDCSLNSDFDPVDIVPSPTTVDLDMATVEREAKLIDPEESQEVHKALKYLSARCDGAREKDGMGFNAMDTCIGKSLAAMSTLTPKQAVLGRRILKKYHGQLN